MAVTALNSHNRGEDLARAFREATRQRAGGIAIVTAGLSRQWSGVVVTSLLPLTDTPPRLLVPLSRRSSVAALVEQDRCFGINLLAAHHELMADHFGGRDANDGATPYRDADWITLETGAPILADALASIDCEVEEVIERYGEMLVVGRVKAVKVNRFTNALVSWRGRYEQLGWSDIEGSLAVGL